MSRELYAYMRMSSHHVVRVNRFEGPHLCKYHAVITMLSRTGIMWKKSPWKMHDECFNWWDLLPVCVGAEPCGDWKMSTELLIPLWDICENPIKFMNSCCNYCDLRDKTRDLRISCEPLWPCHIHDFKYWPHYSLSHVPSSTLSLDAPCSQLLSLLVLVVLSRYLGNFRGEAYCYRVIL